MFRPVQFPAEVEARVRFVEETPRDRIVEETIDRLRAGTSAKEMLTASALAVTRSTDVAVGHHGGPCHELCGVYPAFKISERLPGEWSYMPVVHHVALANEHIHCPEFGPFILPEIEPVEAVDLFNLRHRGYIDASEGTLDETRENFSRMMQSKYPPAAEGHLLHLLGRVPNDEIIDRIVEKALPFNGREDHYFLFPVFTSRALDALGWEWASVLLRPVVRWQARNPYMRGVVQPTRISLTHEDLEEMLEKYQLLGIRIPERSTAGESEAIGQLADRIGHCEDFAEVPEMVAAALGGGMSLEGTGEAISIGSATTFLQSDYGNPMDAHLHTGINSRRYLLGKEHVTLRNKLLALLTAYIGPEITLSMGKLVYPARAERSVIDSLPDRDQPALIEAIVDSLMSIPTERNLHVMNLIHLKTDPLLRDSMALAQQYAEKGYDPMALFVEMGKLACRDDFTEMHALKQHQTAVDEYYTTREPFRWVHLVSAVKFIGFCRGAREAHFEQAKELLRV
jgi:hypothetical protein